MRCIWLLWSALAWLAAVLCTVGCLLPYWLKGSVFIVNPAPLTNKARPDPRDTAHLNVANSVLDPQTGLPTDLGLFRRCGYPVYASWVSDDKANAQSSRGQPPVQWQTGCGHYTDLTHVPHTAWYIGFLLLAIACALLFFITFFLFLMGFALYLISVPSVYRTCQSLLLISGCLTLTACALYPVGWTNNNEVRQACGEEANSFHLGRCHIGWAYVLTCSGGLLSVFAAALPIIFPKQIQLPVTSGFRSLTDSGQRTDESVGHMSKLNETTLSCTRCCNSSSSSDSFSRIGSTPAGSVAAFVQRTVPSPAHSLAMSQRNSRLVRPPNQQQLGSLMFLPTSSTTVCAGGGTSSCGSSYSPVQESSLIEKPYSSRSSLGPATSYASLHNTTTASRPMLRPGHALHPLSASYAPQRYSTGALLGHFYPLTTHQRVTPSLNIDPLIYVAEEEEGDHDHATLNGRLPDVSHVLEVARAVSVANESPETELSSPPIHGDADRASSTQILPLTAATQTITRVSDQEVSFTETRATTTIPLRWLGSQTYSPLVVAADEQVTSADSASSTMQKQHMFREL